MSRLKRFSDFLDVVGFEQAPFAWHISGIEFEDYKQVVDALKGTTREFMG